MSKMNRSFLIVGGTGQQGRATIDALQSSASDQAPCRILVLTRSVASPKSQSLQATYPDITLVEGDTRKPANIFAENPEISAVFLVTTPPSDEEQALPFIEAAVAPGTNIDHVVFSSVDRGGDQASWNEPTQVPHFATKHRIELQLRTLCEKAGKRWTILRPTGFMDTYNPGFFGKMMASLWAQGMPADRRMQLISTHDIGVFAANALLHPDEWAGKAVGLAGDELSFEELQETFRRVVGKELPQTYGLLAQGVLWWVEDAQTSFEWFRTAGYGADIKSLREQEPGLQTFERWLLDSSEWKERK
jgi:uncharacterized protein YbjT (DUF2867 family)